MHKSAERKTEQEEMGLRVMRLTHDDRRRAVVELDNEQRQNLTMRHQDISALAWDMLLLPLSITRPDDNLDLGITGLDDNLDRAPGSLVGSPRGDILPGGRQRWTTEGDVIQNFRSKTERGFN
jgi:hypothetical protein